MDRIRPLVVVFGILMAAGCSHQRSFNTGNVSGTVSDSAGAPVLNAPIVILSSTSNEPYPAMAPITNEQGQFRYPNLPVGTYVIRASGPDGNKDDVQVEVRSQGTSDVKFRLPSAGHRSKH